MTFFFLKKSQNQRKDMKRSRYKWTSPLPQDLLKLVLSCLHDVQLTYWMCQITEDGSSLRLLMECAHELNVTCMNHILTSIQDRIVIDGAMQKCKQQWGRYDTEHMVLHAPIWFLEKYFPFNAQKHEYYLEIVEELSLERMQKLHDTWKVASWTTETQNDLFTKMLCFCHLEMIQWFWEHSTLKDQPIRCPDLSILSKKELLFVIEHCYVPNPMLSRWDNLETVQLAIQKWPNLLDQCKSENLTVDVAIYLWPLIKNTTQNFFNNFDKAAQEFCNGKPMLQKMNSNKEYAICFDGDKAEFEVTEAVYKESDIFQWRGHKQPTHNFYHHLVTEAVKNTQDTTALFEDARQWMTRIAQSAYVDNYFESALQRDVGALVRFLWLDASENKRAVWRESLQQRIVTCREESLIQFAAEQLHTFFADRADLIMQSALAEHNFELWKFTIAHLSPRERYRACEWSMAYPPAFFEAVWKQVDHRHTNDLFRLALATQSAEIAFVLSNEPEFEPNKFSHAVPSLITLQLYPVLKLIHFPAITREQQLWCATRVIKNQNNDLLDIVFAKLGLSVQDWHDIVFAPKIKSMPSYVIESFLRLGILSGKELYTIDHSLFASELRVVHYDI